MNVCLTVCVNICMYGTARMFLCSHACLNVRSQCTGAYVIASEFVRTKVCCMNISSAVLYEYKYKYNYLFMYVGSCIRAYFWH